MWQGSGVFGMGGGIFMWLFWILLIVGIIWAVRSVAACGGDAREPRRSALEILKERYAKGEIDEEEYDRKREKLSE
jgi:putative membrane protein